MLTSQQTLWIVNLLLGATEEQLKILAENEAAKMRQMDCYIGVRGRNNLAEMSDVPEDKLALYDKLYMNPVHHEIRVPHTKWVVLRYPRSVNGTECTSEP